MKVKTLKNISFLALIWGFLSLGHAQQEAQFTQYMFNKLSYNPGYAGTSGSICLTGLYRDQWMGLALDSPAGGESGVTPHDFLFTLDSPIPFLHGGIGATIIVDKVGYNSSYLLSMDYAYHVNWGSGVLSIGLEGGYNMLSINYSNLFGFDDMTGDPSNPTNSSNDPLLTGQEVKENLIDASFGLFYQEAGKFYAGVSMKNILAAKAKEMNFQNTRCIYFMGGYEYVLPAQPSIRILPSALIKTADFSVYQIDLSCLVEYDRSVWGGLSYRYQDAIAVLAGVNWKKMRLGFSYDFTVSDLGGISKPGRSKGSVEVYLRYCFNIVITPKPPSSYINTRYLL
jgi:type IX secretion system PorP/SprF family membrane protein